MENKSIDCTSATAETVRHYYDRGFAVKIPVDRFGPFLKWLMKKSPPGSEKHKGWKESKETVTIKKIGS